MFADLYIVYVYSLSIASIVLNISLAAVIYIAPNKAGQYLYTQSFFAILEKNFFRKYTVSFVIANIYFSIVCALEMPVSSLCELSRSNWISVLVSTSTIVLGILSFSSIFFYGYWISKAKWIARKYCRDSQIIVDCWWMAILAVIILAFASFINRHAVVCKWECFSIPVHKLCLLSKLISSTIFCFAMGAFHDYLYSGKLLHCWWILTWTFSGAINCIRKEWTLCSI